MEFQIKNGTLFIDGKIFHLDNVIFLEEYGVGANCKVFTVYHEKLNRKEIVKILKKILNYKSREKFIEEIRKNAQLRHEHIPIIYDSNTIGDICYCRMEYIAGETLEKFLKFNHQSFEKRYDLLVRILDIMDSLYLIGIYHGDLHTGNIIIEQKIMKVYLIDIGSSVLSGKEKFHKRDSKKLFETSLELMPELKEMPFFTNDIIERGSELVSKFVRATSHIVYMYICDHANGRGGIANRLLVSEIDKLKKEFSFLNEQSINDFIIKVKRYDDTLIEKYF